MSRFFKILEREYTLIDSAKNVSTFSDITSGVYLWFAPIKLNYKQRDVLSTFDLFYSVDYLKYSILTETLVEDNNKRLKSIILNTAIDNPTKYLPSKLLDPNDDLLNSGIAELFFAFSTLNRPIYIGKSSPRNMESDRDLSDRIKEHLRTRSDFGKNLKEFDESIDLRDMIVKAIDVGRIEKDFFNNNFSKEKQDLSLIIESHLIRILKPTFNIKF